MWIVFRLSQRFYLFGIQSTKCSSLNGFVIEFWISFVVQIFFVYLNPAPKVKNRQVWEKFLSFFLLHYLIWSIFKKIQVLRKHHFFFIFGWVFPHLRAKENCNNFRAGSLSSSIGKVTVNFKESSFWMFVLSGSKSSDQKECFSCLAISCFSKENGLFDFQAILLRALKSVSTYKYDVKSSQTASKNLFEPKMLKS